MESVPCDTCGATLERYPSQIKENNFCDRQCYTEYRETLTGEKAPNYQNKTSTYECEICGEPFERPDAWVSDERKARTCSKRCHASLLRRERAEVTLRHDKDGYEVVQSGNEIVRVHRLIAVADYGVDFVADRVVHHRIDIPWLNFDRNLEPVTKAQHRKVHS